MSYTVFFQKFEKKESANITFFELEKILSTYGKIKKGNFGLEFISDVGEMFESATLHGTVEEGISGISFDRPTMQNTIPNLIFDLLGIKNTCFFGTDLEFVHSRYEMIEHYPVAFIENLSEKPKVISSAMESWPF